MFRFASCLAAASASACQMQTIEGFCRTRLSPPKMFASLLPLLGSLCCCSIFCSLPLKRRTWHNTKGRKLRHAPAWLNDHQFASPPCTREETQISTRPDVTLACFSALSFCLASTDLFHNSTSHSCTVQPAASRSKCLQKLFFFPSMPRQNYTGPAAASICF